MSNNTALVVIAIAVLLFLLSITAGMAILGAGKDQSVECIKAGGQWVPTNSFNGYCERKGH